VAAVADARVTRTYFMLLVADMDRAVRFYRDTFGGHVTLTSPHWSEVTLAGATVALHSGGTGADTATGLGFEVEDLDDAMTAVTRAGGRVVGEPRERAAERIRLAEVADPDGNRVTVAQVLR
jgi:lactoylglutathione lyase